MASSTVCCSSGPTSAADGVTRAVAPSSEFRRVGAMPAVYKAALARRQAGVRRMSRPRVSRRRRDVTRRTY